MTGHALPALSEFLGSFSLLSRALIEPLFSSPRCAKGVQSCRVSSRLSPEDPCPCTPGQDGQFHTSSHLLHGPPFDFWTCQLCPLLFSVSAPGWQLLLNSTLSLGALGSYTCALLALGMIEALCGVRQGNDPRRACTEQPLAWPYSFWPTILSAPWELPPGPFLSILSIQQIEFWE